MWFLPSLTSICVEYSWSRSWVEPNEGGGEEPEPTIKLFRPRNSAAQGFIFFMANDTPRPHTLFLENHVSLSVPVLHWVDLLFRGAYFSGKKCSVSEPDPDPDGSGFFRLYGSGSGF